MKGSLGWEEREELAWRTIFRALNRVSLWLQGNAAARSDLLKLALPTAYGFPAALAEGEGMSAAFTWRRLQGVKLGVHPGVPRAVLQSRVPASQGPVCQGRDSVSSQGWHSACPRSSQWQRGEKQWVEKATAGRRRSFWLQEGAVWARSSHSSRSPQDISEGTFQGEGQGGDSY